MRRRQRAEPSLENGPPIFKLLWRDREIALREGENILGRDEASVAWIDVSSVSRHHARIVVSGDRATVEDLGQQERDLPEGAARRRSPRRSPMATSSASAR